jgi:hypothetical protein
MITKETTLKEIIPQGYELTGHYNITRSVIDNPLTIDVRLRPIKQFKFDSYKESYMKDRNFNQHTDFEFNIGLFQYICHDLKFNFIHCIDMITSDNFGIECSLERQTLVDILPESFIDYFKKITE